MGRIDWVAIVGIVGTLGTLGGTLAGYALSWWIERRRWEREDRHRFTQDRRELYARFNAEVMDLFAKGGASGMEAASIMSLQSQIMMMAQTPEVRAAAMDLTAFVIRIDRAESRDEAKRIAADAAGAEYRFLSSVRSEFGLDPIDSPDQPKELR